MSDHTHKDVTGGDLRTAELVGSVVARSEILHTDALPAVHPLDAAVNRLAIFRQILGCRTQKCGFRHTGRESASGGHQKRFQLWLPFAMIPFILQTCVSSGRVGAVPAGTE